MEHGESESASKKKISKAAKWQAKIGISEENKYSENEKRRKKINIKQRRKKIIVAKEKWKKISIRKRKISTRNISIAMFWNENKSWKYENK